MINDDNSLIGILKRMADLWDTDLGNLRVALPHLQVPTEVSSDTVRVRIVAYCDAGSTTLHFRAPRSIAFRKLMIAWCTRQGLSLSEVNFRLGHVAERVRLGAKLQASDPPTNHPNLTNHNPNQLPPNQLTNPKQFSSPSPP